MSQQLKHKIDANDTSISKLLKEQKFYIDYFQREYRWDDKHMKTLIEDVTSAFLSSYENGDKRPKVASYQNYYLGPVVFSKNPDDGKKSIIDGQQRITSITLFLIFLNHLQQENHEKVNISELIFSEKFGEKSFNMTDENRHDCLESLFYKGNYQISDNDNETVINIVKRYEDISQVFPEEITEHCLPHFIDWFTENVVIVEIIAYSDDNAYTIFETMNDRGLSLTSTEMLKGYVLSRIRDRNKRNEINDIWKDNIKLLNELGKNADQSFFLAWFRSKYALNMRPGKVGSVNQDFENIGTKFHNWFKESHEGIFSIKSSDDFYNFFKIQFPFFVDLYLSIWKARKQYTSTLPHLYYAENLGIADSLQEPLLFAPIVDTDTAEQKHTKLDLVSKYIEILTVKRSVNYKKYSQASIKYTMFNIIKKIRNNDIDILKQNLIEVANEIEYKFDKLSEFRLHGQNRKFIKHFLSRITGFIDHQLGRDSNYVSYYNPKGKEYQIEHIWGNKFEQHKDEFEQINEFEKWRNLIGALILIPEGTNQSYSDAPYEIKLSHYIKENSYAQTLHDDFYSKNPNFLNNSIIQKLNFKSHSEFKKQDIADRTLLIQKICEMIWKIEL